MKINRDDVTAFAVAIEYIWAAIVMGLSLFLLMS